MVDFNNETTIGTPAVDVVRILILQARAYVFDALENYLIKSYSGVDVGLDVVRARLMNYYLQMRSALKRRKGQEQINIIESKLKQTDLDSVLYVLNFMDDELDAIKLITIDTKRVYDRTKWETENKVHGY